ncbi:MAG: hypothetical protein IKJ65_02850 [Clostridia bacterium]|nr:hypothetical protein [Clostridia bacterium]
MKRFFCALFIALILLSACVLFAFAEEPVTTTVMVYMCGSNLESREGLATKDVFEMIESGYDTDYTDVYLMTGGTTAWSMSSIDAKSTSIYHMKGSGIKNIWKDEMMNMGSGETLRMFLQTVFEQTDTDQYILILWDHGGGPLSGVCLDENFDNDYLSLFELQEGLSQSPFADRKLDIIGFDACLMSSVETAWLVSPYAKYMVASAEREPGSGWNYSFLAGIESDKSLIDTGRRIIDAYIGSFPADYGSPLTLAMTDLSVIEEVISEMSVYFTRINSILNDNLFQDIAALRYGAQGYGRDFRAVESTDYDLVDVVSFLKACEKHDLPVEDSLMDAINKAVVAIGSNLADSVGLSVYFPYHNQKEYALLGENFLSDTQFCPGYVKFIDHFQAYLHGEKIIEWTGLTPDIERRGEGFEISLALTESQREDMVSARLVLLDSMIPAESVNCSYKKVFSVSDIADRADGISAEYHDENLVFSYTEKSGAKNDIGPIEFIVNDDGEYQLDVLASNLTEIGEASYDDPGLSRMMRLILSPPDETGECVIRSVLVYDSALNRFTNRTGDTIENYKFLHFLSYQRFLTKEDGMILPYEAWGIYGNDADGISRPIIAIADAHIASALDWRFCVKTQYGMRYAAFEITDSRNNTFLTEPVLIRPLTESTLYHQRASVKGMPIEFEFRAVAESPSSVIVWMNLTNLSEKDTLVFKVRDVRINGQLMDSHYSQNVDWNMRIDSGDGGYTQSGSQTILYESGGRFWTVAAPKEKATLYIAVHFRTMIDILRTGRMSAVSFSIDIINDKTDKYLGALENITLKPEIFFPDLYENYR